MSTPITSKWLRTLDAAHAAGMLKAVPRSHTVKAKGLILRCLRALDELGYELLDLESLSHVHVQALARFRLHTDSPEHKRRTRLEALHAFVGELTGRFHRDGVVGHFARAQAVLSACAAARALCWSAVGIDVDGMLRRIAERDRYVAMQLSLQRVFGLHVAEVLALKPHEADRGNCLLVESARGKRRVSIETGEQRAVLAAAKALVPYPGAGLHAVRTPACDVVNRYHSECFHAGFRQWGLRLRGQSIRFEYRLAGVLAESEQRVGFEHAR